MAKEPLWEPSRWSDRELRRRAERMRRRRAERGGRKNVEPVESLAPRFDVFPRLRVETAWRLLELEPGASLERARRAYRELMERYHPDAHLGDPRRHADAVRLARALTAAWLSLHRADVGRSGRDA